MTVAGRSTKDGRALAKAAYGKKATKAVTKKLADAEEVVRSIVTHHGFGRAQLDERRYALTGLQGPAGAMALDLIRAFKYLAQTGKLPDYTEESLEDRDDRIADYSARPTSEAPTGVQPLDIVDKAAPGVAGDRDGKIRSNRAVRGSRSNASMAPVNAPGATTSASIPH